MRSVIICSNHGVGRGGVVNPSDMQCLLVAVDSEAHTPTPTTAPRPWPRPGHCPC